MDMEMSSEIEFITSLSLSNFSYHGLGLFGLLCCKNILNCLAFKSVDNERT